MRWTAARAASASDPAEIGLAFLSSSECDAEEVLDGVAFTSEAVRLGAAGSGFHSPRSFCFLVGTGLPLKIACRKEARLPASGSGPVSMSVSNSDLLDLRVVTADDS